MKVSNIFFGAIGVCFFTSATLASNVADSDILTFTANATAKSADVNQNFTKLKAANNDNDARITTNTTNITTNSSDITTLQTTVAGKVNKAGDTITGPLIVNGDVTAPSFTYSTPKTQYLMLSGGICVHATSPATAVLPQNFYCELGDGTTARPGFWNVNVPNGASLLGIQVRLYTGVGPTTCTLRYGTNNFGTTIGTVTDSTSGWHTTTETTLTHTVDMSTSAYSVDCANANASNQDVIGFIRIRYTTTGL